MKRAGLLVALLFLFLGKAGAQIYIKDTLVHCFAIAGNFGYHVPGGNLAERFGNNASVGASALYKSKKNFVYSLNWNYLFGNDIKELSVLDSLITGDGFVIDKEGKYADLHLFERGFTLNLSAGKIFNNVLSPNRNSGLYLAGSVGYLQHKIRIYDNGSRTPQLSGDYLKGYDRLTSGLAFTEFAGYWFMSPRRYINFYAGFEFTQGITKSRRSWDFDLMRRDTRQRTDLLYGVRVGWIIPIFRNNSENRYY